MNLVYSKEDGPEMIHINNDSKNNFKDESKDDSGVSEDLISIDLDEEKSEKEEDIKGTEDNDEGIESPGGTEAVADLEDMESIEDLEDKQGTEETKTEESEDPESMEDESEVAEQEPESQPDVENVIDDEIWDELPFFRVSISY